MFWVNRMLYLGVFLLTCSTLVLEVALTRLFSVVLSYHFAFMAVSLALFGLGAGGVCVYVLKARFPPRALPRHASAAALLYAASIVIVLQLLLGGPLAVQASVPGVVKLGLVFGACAVPFFLSGLCLSLIFYHRAEAISLIYFVDLLGAAAGCPLAIVLMNGVGAPGAIWAAALLGALAIAGFSAGDPSPAARTIRFAAPAMLIAAFVVQVAGGGLDLTYSKGREERYVDFSRWNSLSRVTAAEVATPHAVYVSIDADAETTIHAFSGDWAEVGALRRKIGSLAYALKPGGAVLVLGAGGGPDVLTALSFGAAVTAVEINDIIVNDLMLGRYFELSGRLYALPGVEVHLDEGRSFVRRSPQQFDVIQASLTDTWAATSAGAFALSENYLYTVEAFLDYFDRLKPDGVLTISRWLLNPPQQELRLAAIGKAALARRGILDSSRYFFIARDTQPHASGVPVANFMFKKSGFTSDDVATLRQVATEQQAAVVYDPFEPGDSVFHQLIATAQPDEFYRRYPLDVTPSTDDRPFFFYTLRLRDLLGIGGLEDESRKNNAAMVVVGALVVIGAVVMLLAMVVPFALTRHRAGSTPTSVATTLRLLSYFSLVGLGFMGVEMALMQQLGLFLGHPVYALTVVLFSILVFSGIGSYSTTRCTDAALARRLGAALVVLAGFIVLYRVGLGHAVSLSLAQELPIRIGLSVLLLAPIGILLGMPFPLGLRLASRRSRDLIPWAWGLNGVSSVLGSVLSMLLAISFGFGVVLLAAAAAYGAAFAVTGWEDA